MRHSIHTNVAEIPGYPTKKLLFGGPDTLTNAAITSPGGRQIDVCLPAWAVHRDSTSPACLASCPALVAALHLAAETIRADNVSAMLVSKVIGEQSYQCWKRTPRQCQPPL